MSRCIAVALSLFLVLSCGGERDGDGGVEGRSLLVDDTGRGDVADGGGWMIAVPAGRTADLWAAVGEPDDLRRASFTIDRAGAEAVGGMLAEIDDDGEYTLDAQGATLVCRLPAVGSTRGCAEVDLSPSGRLVTSFGEGGFVARVED